MPDDLQKKFWGWASEGAVRLAVVVVVAVRLLRPQFLKDKERK